MGENPTSSSGGDQTHARVEAKSSIPDPDIVELFDHYHIDPRHQERFQAIMESREATFEGDMLKMWELLEQARSPEGMFISKMREMEMGTFVGKTVPDAE